MPLAYGQRTTPKPPRSLLVFILAVAGVVIGGVAFSSAVYHRELAAEQGWTSNAAPCPSIAAAAYRARYAAGERLIIVEGATVARQYGHVMCADVDTAGWWGLVSHPECQFTSANAIRVKTAGAEAFFEPGPGAPATVSLEPGGIRCALSGKFTLLHDPTK